MLRLQALERRRPDTCLGPIFLTCRRPATLHSPLQTTSTIAATQWASLGVDAAFDLARFKRGFDINITRYEGDDMEFEMKGVSCAVRRMPCNMQAQMCSSVWRDGTPAEEDTCNACNAWLAEAWWPAAGSLPPRPALGISVQELAGASPAYCIERRGA